MLIYNVTVNIDDAIHSEWLKWIKPHISDVLATGCFTEAKLTRVLVEEEMGGVTYSIQYRTKSRTLLNTYYKDYAEKLQQDGLLKFANGIVAFRTELEIIEEFTVTP